MTPEIFFEKFDQLANAPNAVAKMRELVLRMATSGRIAEQNPSDQPASELLDEIFAIRDKLIHIGATKSRVEGNPITAGDTIALPPSWGRCMISEVCDLQTGATPSRQEHSYFGGDIPWLVSGDINKGEITECEGRITKEGLKNSNCKIIPKNSVLIALNGQGKTRATVAVLRIPAALNQSLVAMIPYSVERLLPEYILWNLRGRYYAIRDVTGQDQRRGLNMKLVGQLSIPIPPLAEQKRIVAKVDELMVLCDRLEAQQREREARHAALARASLARFADAPTPANLNFLFHDSYSIDPTDLRKTILTLAVQGKLVPQDPNDEPAEELIERIKAAREALVEERRVRQSEEVEYSLRDEVDDAPPGWVGVHVNDVAIVQGGKRLPNGAVFSESLTPHVYIRVTDMKNGTISEANLRYISPEVHREIARYIINKEDLYITIAGTIGDVGSVPESLDGHNLTENAAKIVFRGFDKKFFQLVLTSEFVQAQFLEKTKQMAQPKLALKRIAGAKFYLPPLAEQRRIVEKVDELMALVDSLEIQLSTARTTAERLMEAVVAELTT